MCISERTTTVFTLAKTYLKSAHRLLIALFFVLLVIIFLSYFLKTKIGLAIRATGNNPAMVASSSINPAFTTTVGLCIANSFTALSGCLLAQSQKSVSIDIGRGMLTGALASLLIGSVLVKKNNITLKAVGCVLGAIVFRLIYTMALRFNMPAYMLKLVSACIVIIAISAPYLKLQLSNFKKRQRHQQEGKKC